MDEFVHTFSLKRLIPSEEFDPGLLKRDDLFFYVEDEKKWVLKGYDDTGIRVELKALNNESALRKYDNTHPRYEVETIVTPGRIIDAHPRINGLTDSDKIQAACEKLKCLTDSIFESTGIELLHKAKLYRVDVTKDVLTPNDFYSHEIIKAAKHSLKNSNYRLYNPATNINCVVYWRLEDSMMFKGKKFWAKIYNKKRDLSLNKERYEQELEALEEYGLLRFEISLLRDFLRDSYGAKGFVEIEKLAEIICSITKDASSLMEKCFVRLFYEGAMVSRSVMKKIIERRRKKGQWSRTVKNMMEFSDWITHTDPEVLRNEEAENPLWDGSLIQRFETIGLSAVHVDKKTPYIPSFSDLIHDEIDSKLLGFSKMATKRKRKELVYWG